MRRLALTALVCCLPAVPCAHAVAAVAQTPVRSWQVPAPEWTAGNEEAGRVDAILRVGRRLFVGGNFTALADHAGHTATRMHLAALRPRDGALLGFAPKINGRVYALASAGGYLFVGGAFSSIGGHPRHGLAAFNLTTGRLSGRIPDLGFRGAVDALAVARGAVIAGGSFTAVAGRRRAHLAKLVLSGARYTLGRWAPQTNGQVLAVRIAVGTRVLIGGSFSSVNGRSQPHLAAVGLRDAGLRGWANHPQAPILALAIRRRAVYAAEAGAGGTALRYDAVTGRLAWFYRTDGNVQAVAVVGRAPVFGMHGDYVAPHRNAQFAEFSGSARIERRKLFMLSRRGLLLRWNPSLTSTAGVLGVWALAAGRGNVYVGGDFTAVHGVVQKRIAILRRL
jgi:hypothetical protein